MMETKTEERRTKGGRYMMTVREMRGGCKDGNRTETKTEKKNEGNKKSREDRYRALKKEPAPHEPVGASWIQSIINAGRPATTSFITSVCMC